MSNEHSTHPADNPLSRGDLWAYMRLTSAADLSSNALLVLLRMVGFADPDGSNVRPTVATLAAATNLSERAVKNATRELRAAGWLEVQAAGGCFEGKNRATLYRLAVGVSRPSRHSRESLATPSRQSRETLAKSADGVHEVPPRGAGGAPHGVHEVPPRGARGAYYPPSNPPIEPTQEPTQNTSDAPSRRCPSIPDGIEEAHATSERESAHDECTVCHRRPGRVTVLVLPSGKARQPTDQQLASHADGKLYPNARVVHYCLVCATKHRSEASYAWWQHPGAA